MRAARASLATVGLCSLGEWFMRFALSFGSLNLKRLSSLASSLLAVQAEGGDRGRHAGR